jgi:hypothetical protein
VGYLGEVVIQVPCTRRFNCRQRRAAAGALTATATAAQAAPQGAGDWWKRAQPLALTPLALNTLQNQFPSWSITNAALAQARELARLLGVPGDTAALIMERTPELRYHPVHRLQSALTRLTQALKASCSSLNRVRIEGCRGVM